MPPIQERSINVGKPVYFHKDGHWQAGMIIARTATQELVHVIKSETIIFDHRVVLHEEDNIQLLQPDPNLDTVYIDERLDA